MKLYHNANASDVDSFSTRRNGTKRQPRMEGEVNCEGKNANIGYEWTPIVGQRPYIGIHFRSHLWTGTDTQCFRRQGWKGMGPLLWYNFSWSSHNSSLFTNVADVAAGAGVRLFASGVLPSSHIWRKRLTNPITKWIFGGGSTPMLAEIKSIAPIRWHPARGSLNPPVTISLGRVAMISLLRLSRQAAGSTHQATSWPLTHRIGMR